MGYRGRTKQLVLLLSLLCFGTATAQRFALDSRTYFDYGNQLTIISRQLPETDSLRVYVNTANTLFSFVKSDKSLSPRGAYYAVRDISIELREENTGTVLASKNLRDTIFASIFLETTSKDAWNSRVVSLPLSNISKPRKIEVHTEVRDGFLSRLADKPNTEDIELRSFTPRRSITISDSSYIGVGDPVLFDFNTASRINSSRNWGELSEFGRDLSGCIPIAMPANIAIDSIRITFRQTKDVFQRKNFKPSIITSQVISIQDILNDKILSIKTVDSIVTYVFESKNDSTIHNSLALFRIAGAMLDQGEYELVVRVYSGAESRTIKQPLTLEWHNMPLSLENPRDAIPPMQYLMSEEEYSNISSGSKDDQLEKLYQYWKKQDPSPNTAYNERMAEFYHRTDYAYFNFARNPRQLDGAMTDRGKIYILFGPPTNIQRSFLLGEQPVEIWTYGNNVKKICKFIDQNGRGEYKLVDVKPL